MYLDIAQLDFDFIAEIGKEKHILHFIHHEEFVLENLFNELT